MDEWSHTKIYDIVNLTLVKTYADSALHYAQQFGEDIGLSEAHLRMYRTLRLLDDSRNLAYHINKALDHAEASKHNITELNVYQEASEFYSKKGNHLEGYRLLFLADSLKSEIFSEEKANNLRKFEKQLIQEQSQEEINLLNAQNDITQLKLTNSRRWILATCGGLGVLGLFSLTLVRLNQKIKSQNKIIGSALSEKETLLREIHHRVKNNLQFISSLLGLQSDHVEDKAALGALQEGQDRVQSMALIHQNLYQEDNLTGVDVHDYFNKLIQGLFDSYNIHDDRIQLELDIEDINLDVDTVIPMGLIVNELITNSLKYAFPKGRDGLISIKMKEQNEALHLSVSDNGTGMSEEVEKNLGDSFGYRLVDAFNRQLDADMSIDRSAGTSVNIVIRNYQVAT